MRFVDYTNELDLEPKDPVRVDEIRKCVEKLREWLKDHPCPGPLFIPQSALQKEGSHGCGHF